VLSGGARHNFAGGKRPPPLVTPRLSHRRGLALHSLRSFARGHCLTEKAASGAARKNGNSQQAKTKKHNRRTEN
jgi:hypothetical protein